MPTIFQAQKKEKTPLQCKHVLGCCVSKIFHNYMMITSLSNFTPPNGLGDLDPY